MHESTLARSTLRRVSKQAALSPEATQLAPAIEQNSPSSHIACKVGIAAITENMLKRKWSATILRHINSGASDPVRIVQREPGLSAKVLSERLRTMHRYALVTRCPMASGAIDYTITFRGRKILEILNIITVIERQLDEA